MTTDICGSLLALAAIAFAIGFPFVLMFREHKLIRAALEKKGARNITISWLPFRLSAIYKRIYVVAYEDRKGNRRERDCWVTLGVQRIHWKDT